MYVELKFTITFLPLQAVLLCGRKFIDEGHSSSDEIKARCDQLQENWDELKNLAEQRQHKLDESLAYQQFSANVGEEESWINEKNTLVGSDDYGDTLAAVQVRELFRVTHSLPFPFQILLTYKEFRL